MNYRDIAIKILGILKKEITEDGGFQRIRHAQYHTYMNY